MQVPLVSVNMVTYNHEPFIAQAIEGVLMQETDFPFELVIGEDCSTDRTRDIVLEYQERYPDIIRVITSETNVGGLENCLRVERACCGKYIAYCDGDDYWHHVGKLQKQVDFLESHPEYGLAHSDLDRLNATTGEKLEYVRSQTGIHYHENDQDDLTIDLLLGRYMIATCTVLARKCLIDRIVESDPAVFQSNRFALGDLPRWLEISRLSKIKYFGESWATYRILEESASHSRDSKRMIYYHRSRYDLLRYYAEKLHCDQQAIHSLETLRAVFLLRLALCTSNSELARETWSELHELGIRRTWQMYLLTWGARIPCTDLLVRIGRTLRNVCRRTIRRIADIAAKRSPRGA